MNRPPLSQKAINDFVAVRTRQIKLELNRQIGELMRAKQIWFGSQLPSNEDHMREITTTRSTGSTTP